MVKPSSAKDDPVVPPSAKENKAAVGFDDLLVAVGNKKDRDAFIRLFEYFAPRVKSFLMRGGLNKELADELAQETMLTVWHRAGSYDPDKASASTWIYTVARNKKIDWLRRKNRAEPDFNDPLFRGPERPQPDDLVYRTQEAKALAKAMKDLPSEQAEIVKKVYFEDKTHSQIAKETSLPLGTVKSRLRLAMDRLHHNLGNERP